MQISAGTPVSVERAFEIISTNSGFVQCGGYVLYKDGYFAAGEFPGCMRGGKSCETLEEFREFCGDTHTEWLELNPDDIIANHGYWPVHHGIWTAVRDMDVSEEFKSRAFALDEKLLRYMIDSEHKTADFKSGFASRNIWVGYFD